MSRPKLSQVLLTDDRWRNRLAASVPQSEFGVEWAAGRGALTDFLLDAWGIVLSLEIDADFCGELRERYRPERLWVVRANILNFPLPERNSPYPVVGNLPYHLTGPCLMKLAEQSEKLSGFQGLLQREVANRITASPGDSDYRAISILMQWSFEVTVLEDVPASAFTPVPEVDSSWIRLVPRDCQRPFEAVRQFASVCFEQPRKTLLNNLARSAGSKDRWKQWFLDRGWNPKRRPHTLTVNELLEAYDTWQTK